MAFEVIRMGETIQDCESLSMLLNVNIEDPMLEDSICGLQSFILLKSITCRAGVWQREGIVTRLEYHLYFPTLPGDFTSLSRHSIRPENEIYYKYCKYNNIIISYAGRITDEEKKDRALLYFVCLVLSGLLHSVQCRHCPVFSSQSISSCAASQPFIAFSI